MYYVSMFIRITDTSEEVLFYVSSRGDYLIAAIIVIIAFLAAIQCHRFES